jgi:chemotaxis protein methyltransferase CheR
MTAKRYRIIGEPDYPALKAMVLEHTGLAYYADKDRDLAERIERRMQARGVREAGEYLRLLREGDPLGEEHDALAAELTIGETYFFRHLEHFDALRETILPELIERNHASRRLHIWSAGCATGAEAYSVALLLHQELEPRVAGWDTRILGTDINRAFLARAREARFDDWTLRDSPPEFKEQYFKREEKHWILKPEYRAGVSFHYQNLARYPFPSAVMALAPFDLILCRNVMIYFGAELVRATADRLYETLAVGGWLLVGHAEPNAAVFGKYRAMNKAGVTLYQKSAAVPETPPAWPAILPEVQPEMPPQPFALLPGASPPERPAATREDVPPSVDEARRLADRGEWEAAAAECRRVIEKNGLNAAAHFTLALILEHSGTHADAERSLRRAIYLDRTFALAHYHLGLSLHAGGRDPGQALKAFENVLRLLAGRTGDELVEYADGMSVAELRELARMHMELLNK